MEEEHQGPSTPASLPQVPPELEREPARGGLDWLAEGLRVLTFRAPRWEGLDARPLTLAALVVAGYLSVLAVQWAGATGESIFLWEGIFGGWPAIAFTAWLCWIATRSNTAGVKAATLFALSLGAWVVFGLGLAVVSLGVRVAVGPEGEWPDFAQWAGSLLLVAGLAQAVLLWRSAATGLSRVAVLVLAPVSLMLGAWAAPAIFWWSIPSTAEAGAEPEYGLKLTDEIVDAQPGLFDAALSGLRAPQSGRVNVYALTFAPYASEDVFMRESAVVATTMRERFGAQAVELVVNPATTASLPWATPLNLRNAIAHAATLMDRDRDVLFLHLTSHGGADGKLATDTAPLQTESMTPALLKRWLDEAGVRWRVISVSACYSGSWIAPLQGDGTLVMTAADADHTSYGCGKYSELTFFGRAMYEEELRKTRSFTEAHAAARKVIEVREKEAGKSDGYSNPQISEGAGIRPVLQRLAEEQR